MNVVLLCADNCIFRAVLLGMDCQGLKLSKALKKEFGKRPKHSRMEAEDPRPAKLRMGVQARLQQCSGGPLKAIAERVLPTLGRARDGSNKHMADEAIGVLARVLKVDLGVIGSAPSVDHLQVTLYSGVFGWCMKL